MANKQSQHTNDSFRKQIQSRYNQQQIDNKRVKRIQMLAQAFTTKQTKNQNEGQYAKAPVKFHKFREDARKFHRQLAQQNHDFLKITTSITKSVLDNNRYEFVLGGKNNKNKIANLSDQKNRDKRQLPKIILDYRIQLNSGLNENKIDTKQMFEIYPYKKLSIELEPNNYIKPEYQFFFFTTDQSKSQKLQSSLIEIVDEGLASDIKREIASLTHYLTYFDYIEFGKYLFQKTKQYQESKYPPEIVQLARNSLKMDDGSDQQDYNKGELIIDTTNSYHRIFQCDQSQLTKPFDSIYFTDLKDFQSYKRLRQNYYKNMKIDAEDIVINTDVRNIISSEKIYLINIIEQMRLSVQLLRTNKQPYLLKTLHEMMKKKIFEYLNLVTGYTTSTVQKRNNINNPHSKIYEFLRKSILYEKPYKTIDKKVLQKYQVLQIWYNLPDKIYGYGRQQIHNALYDLIQETVKFQKNMEYINKYQDLKQKHYDRKYLPKNEEKNGKDTKKQKKYQNESKEFSSHFGNPDSL